MFENIQKYGLSVLSLFLLIGVIFLFHLDWQSSHRGLTFALLDIGQGDALFIESPSGTQVLVDGGPPKKIISQLAYAMPFYDKTIDAIIITNPDADHISGFLDVLKNYKVSHVFEPGTFNDSKIYQNLETEIRNKKIPNTLARRGMKLDLGGGAVIDILFPDRDVSNWTTNDGSIIARLSYGDTSVMLTGDATKETEKIVLAGNTENNSQNLKSTILKVGHHGSRTSTSVEFVKAIMPEYALISDSKDNKYGHPHKETLDTLNKFGVQIFRTDQNGTIKAISDGLKFDFTFIK